MEARPEACSEAGMETWLEACSVTGPEVEPFNFLASERDVCPDAILEAGLEAELEAGLESCPEACSEAGLETWPEPCPEAGLETWLESCSETGPEVGPFNFLARRSSPELLNFETFVCCFGSSSEILTVLWLLFRCMFISNLLAEKYEHNLH